MVVHKGTNRAAQRNVGHARGRLEPGNQSDQVADQDEDENDDEKRRVALAVMPNNLVALAEYKSFNSFERMLQRSGRFHRKPRPDQQEEDQQKTKNQKFHSERVTD